MRLIKEVPHHTDRPTGFCLPLRRISLRMHWQIHEFPQPMRFDVHRTVICSLLVGCFDTAKNTFTCWLPAGPCCRTKTSLNAYGLKQSGNALQNAKLHHSQIYRKFIHWKLKCFLPCTSILCFFNKTSEGGVTGKNRKNQAFWIFCTKTLYLCISVSLVIFLGLFQANNEHTRTHLIGGTEGI